MTRLYVAGPMTGLPDFNYPAFNREARVLREFGYEVENPADNEARLTNPTRYDYLRAGLAQLLTCDGVATLAGWSESQGARWEVDTADILGIPVLPVGEWLRLARS